MPARRPAATEHPREPVPAAVMVPYDRPGAHPAQSVARLAALPLNRPPTAYGDAYRQPRRRPSTSTAAAADSRRGGPRPPAPLPGLRLPAVVAAPARHRHLHLLGAPPGTPGAFAAAPRSPLPLPAP